MRIQLHSRPCASTAKQTKWVVFAKPPFGGPEQVLKYLARYTHRVAISNRRLLSIEDGRVRFEYKDYADGNQTKVMTLAAIEFIRRFLLHILPSGLGAHSAVRFSGQPRATEEAGIMSASAGRVRVRTGSR